MLESWTWTREIGMVQRFDGIHWPFVFTGDIIWTVKVSCLNGLSVVGLGYSLLPDLLFGLSVFFRPLLICLDMECTF